MSARAEPGPGARNRPRRVVALGGGTGLPAVLRGLRRLVQPGDGESLTAVVTMSDDGGSSGRLRRSINLPPPGDLRNCLVALAEEEDLLAALFQHRYSAPHELAGHSVGNLILAALAEQNGCFLKAVELSSKVLRTVGRIIPATLEPVQLAADLDDGTRVVGETRIARCERRIRRISLEPDDVRPTAGVIDAILAADLVVIGPGSLFTSVLPNVVVPGVAEALANTAALVVLVGNLVSEHGEAAGLDLGAHVELVDDHAGAPVVDALLVNSSPIAADVLERYRAEGATPLYWDGARAGCAHVVRRPLLAEGHKLRHDPEATARGLYDAWSAQAAARVGDGAA